MVMANSEGGVREFSEITLAGPASHQFAASRISLVPVPRRTLCGANGPEYGGESD
jgi:hypothetical protein